MVHFLRRKVVSALITLMLAAIAVFSLLRLAPGDAASIIAGADATPEQLADVRERLGLDEPLIVQFFQWFGGLVTGNPGDSFQFNRPITELILANLGSTLELALVGAITLLILGLLMGLALIAERPRWLAKAADALSTIWLSLPVYVSAVIMIFLFAVTWRLLPAGGEVSLFEQPDLSLQYLIMPVIGICLPPAAVLGRLLATEARKIRQEEFVLTAKAKGAAPGRITRRHVLPNSLSPFIVEYGIRLGDLIGGAVIAEALFARNGLGKLLLEAVSNRDYPLAQTLLMLAITLAVVLQLLTEVLLLWLDPRTRTAVMS